MSHICLLMWYYSFPDSKFSQPLFYTSNCKVQFLTLVAPTSATYASDRKNTILLLNIVLIIISRNGCRRLAELSLQASNFVAFSGWTSFFSPVQSRPALRGQMPSKMFLKKICQMFWRIFFLRGNCKVIGLYKCFVWESAFGFQKCRNGFSPRAIWIDHIFPEKRNIWKLHPTFKLQAKTMLGDPFVQHWTIYWQTYRQPDKLELITSRPSCKLGILTISLITV